MSDIQCKCKFCQYQPESNQVLFAVEAVAHVQVWLAGEETALSDFMFDPEDIEKLAAFLGVPVTPADYIWEIAQRLRAK